MCRVTGWITELVRQRPEAWETQILKQWKKGMSVGQFPYLTTDEHQAFAKARLTVFRTNAEWLVVFEILAYVAEADAFIDRVYTYGNRARQRMEWIEFLCPPPGDPEWLPDPFDFEVMLHGRLRHFTPARTDYARAGIDLNEPISGDLMLDRRVQVLRLLTFLLPPHELFLPESQLIEIAGRPEILPIFLQLYEWHHPELGEKPEESLCLRNLARAIAYNRPGLYKCPQALVNTHWSQWPNYFLKR